VTDHITLGVLTASVPLDVVHAVLSETQPARLRERVLPAPVMVYYHIALGLYADVSTREVLRCLLEGARWLGGDGRRATGAARVWRANAQLGLPVLERRTDGLSRSE
jgi:Insertion element 4 transposase N-terminal